MTTSAEVRDRLVDALRLDLVGPLPEDETHQHEVLPQAPSKWYLTGFLVPREASAEQRADDSGDEQVDEMDRPAGGDDESAPETVSARKVFFPSSMGLSVLVAPGVDTLAVEVRWGTYKPQLDAPVEESQTESARETLLHTNWERTPHDETMSVPVKSGTHGYEVEGGEGLRVIVAARPVQIGGIPSGTRSVSVFLVNDCTPAPDARRDERYVFQGRLTVRCAVPFVPRPDVRGQSIEEWDERVADLQYRDDVEYAVGHNISAMATVADGACREVYTVWIPTANVEKVEPTRPDAIGLAPSALSMEALADAEDAEAIRAMLGGVVDAYATWIAAQGEHLPEHTGRAEMARKLLGRAEIARKRIAAGLAALDDPQVLEAFRIANRAMATAARQRFGVERGKPPEQVDPPCWRLFQLAFILLNLAGVADPRHPDRELVDLLFFPTGGGKTESYLGLAAFALVLRRLRNPGVSSSGVTVLMRYTLRLLTLDQLGRAATLICALELLRQDDIEKLGLWPFEIGLWVGQGATPNRMGKKGDKDPHSARARTIAFQNDDRRKPSPIPLENCPWCGTKFKATSFQLLPDTDRPRDLRVCCAGRRCLFGGDNPLPIIAVDEPLYRRLPCFVIATVDKFAGLPWVGHTGALFGKVTRYDDDGFYGPCDPGRGKPLPAPLRPPELVVQDELHLISGPLGTMAGLYETAIDALSETEVEGEKVRPKIIASTATVRRATKQIRALFGRTEVDVFPPPGPNRRDSFFACTRSAADRNPRLYLGVAAQGRSLKVVLLRSYLALMAAARRQWLDAGGAKTDPNPADPYMTLVGYFNSLRELGGSRRIVEDEVLSRLQRYGSRKRVGEEKGPFARRDIAFEPAELTSRVPTNEVADTKRRLALAYTDKERIDVALATNMISVGLDITRLGLMVVLGQPKTAAEYIQATSRVGRDDARPGLVVTLLNVHRPRDRSHYERFSIWHETFYRAVEATSVTPFSPRALDRGLAPVAVALARLGYDDLTAPTRAILMKQRRSAVSGIADILAARAECHDREMSAEQQERLRQRVKGRVKDVLDTWEQIAARNDRDNAGLQYQSEAGKDPPLLRDVMDPELQRRPPEERKFKAPRSLRDVEATTNLWVRNPDGVVVVEEPE